MDDSTFPAQSPLPRESETDGELTARFEREALSPLDPLYRGGLALTGDRFPEDASNNRARLRRPKPQPATPKCTPLHRLSEEDTCAGQLDWFDREIVHYVLLWAPHGEIWDEDVFPRFGMTVEQLKDRFHRIIDTSVPRLGRLAKSDRELLDNARQLARIFGQPR